MTKSIRIKAETWDKMQYLFRNYYDRMIHCVQEYDAPIDVETLTKVLHWTTEQAPVLHSKFVGNIIRPYWKTQPYTMDDIMDVRLDLGDTLDDVVDEFITSMIPTKSNVQYRFGVFSDGKRWVLALLLNHMCMDGGDAKYFMKKLAENYQKALDGRDDFEIKTGSRALEEVYSKFDEEQTKKAKSLYKNISAVKDKTLFPLTKKSKNDVITINKRKIDEQTFTQFRQVGKAMGYTVNDLMLGVYIHSLYEMCDIENSTPLSIPCMVDLRRHVVDGAAHTGLTNHTGFMVCNTSSKGETIKDTIDKVVASIAKSKNDPYLGLYSLPLLQLAYIVFPHFISEFAIKIGYLNPLIGMSNIGIMDPVALKMGDANLVDGYMTGGVKYKPYMQLALTTCNGSVTMTIAIKGNDEDKAIVNRFFDIYERNVREFVNTYKA